MVVEDGHDLEAALQRATAELGIRAQHLRVTRAALGAAIAEHRALFRPQQSAAIRKHRLQALDAMREFADFQPRLWGPLVFGDGPPDRIRLLLSADTPELVAMHLADRHIPWREAEVVLHHSGGRRVTRPALRFMAGDSSVELVTLDRTVRSDPPRDPISGGALETLDTEALTALLAAD